MADFPASTTTDDDTTVELARLFRLDRIDPTGTTAPPTRESVEAFYRMAVEHQDLAPFFADADIGRLKAAQQRHWETLFSAKDTNTLADALTGSKRIGHVHVDAHVEPATYLAGYAALIEDLVVGLTRARAKPAQREDALRTVLRHCFADIAVSLSAYGAESSERDSRERLHALSDSLEREMTTTLSEAHHQVLTLSQVAGQLDEAANEVTAAMDAVSTNAESTRSGVNVVASATQELEASSQEITVQTAGAASKADETMAVIETARSAMVALTESAAAIGDVTDLVQRIAKQTRLLALNATIEAARAGEAGRGFAVVAGEVKALAAETETAIGSVSERTEQISQSTTAVDQALSGIVSGVEEFSERAGSIAASVDEQRAAIAEIARSAEQASRETGQVADQLTVVQDTAKVTRRSADRLTEISDRLGRDVGDMQRRITTMLRASEAGDRREHARVPVGVAGSLTVAGQTLSGYTVDLSEAGALFFPGFEEDAAGRNGTLQLGEAGSVAVRVVASGPIGAHLQLTSLSPAQKDQVAALMREAEALDGSMVSMCQDAAGTLSGALSEALVTGRITADALFDDDYVPITGSNPQQYMTKFVELTDQLFPPVQERVVTGDRRIVFCAAVDRNAFLPTHNDAYSKPQRPDDPVWNTANCRNRRIFDDRAGLLAARNSREFQVQSYVRDMGGGEKQVLKEADCPIKVDGRIWGNLRLAYRT